jgi:hypothetical protein
MTKTPRPAGAQSPADLSYLHPERLRVGSVGVFAGDWAYTGTGRIPVGFIGTYIDEWNGWAVFTCTREVAEAIVADQGRLRKAERARVEASGVRGRNRANAVNEAIAPMWWDGADIVVDERAAHGDDEGLSRITPDDDGRYVVNGWNWTWEAVDPADCDRIAGTIPPFGEHQEYVVLTHTPLRAPHDRLTVTSSKHLPMSGGVAWTAVLRLDGRKVGSIDNQGDGGPTQFHPTTDAFGWRQMRAFADACRWRGLPVTEELVLDALVTEYDLTRAIRLASAKDETLVRLLSDDSFTLVTYTVTGPQVPGREYAALTRELNTRHNDPAGSVWQIWRTNRWTYLGPASTSTPPTIS